MPVQSVRRFIAGLVVLSLALAGRGHHVLCHDHGVHGGDSDPCCSVETSQAGEPVVDAEEVEHTCPICHLGIDLPPEPLDSVTGACGVVWIPLEPVQQRLRVFARLTESPRGPPGLV